MDTNKRFNDADERRELLGYKYDPAEPLCKFGPGGDFVYCWPPREGMQPSSLTKLLNKLVPLVASQPELKLQSKTPEIATVAAKNNRRIKAPTEESENAPSHNAGDKSTDATPATIIKSDSLFAGQPLLFPNDSRARRTVKHKSKHRVRAHRGVAKKRTTHGLPGQGSLFETDFKSAKTA